MQHRSRQPHRTELNDKSRSNIDFQALHHDLINTKPVSNRYDYVLGLIHENAYKMAATLAANNIVLDFGCNTGYGTKILSEVAHFVVGCDVSPKAIQSAQQMNRTTNNAFVRLDGLSSPFKDYAFDLLTCFQVIEHVQDTRSFLRIIAKLLKNDGAVILSTPNAALRLYPGMQPWNKFHVREYSAEELEATLKGSFANVRIFGLFAKGPADGIERKRVASARARATNGGVEGDEAAHINFKHFVDAFVRKIIQTSATLSLFGKPFLRHFDNSIGKCSTFYLRDSNVDQALDLMAICTHERRSLDHAREVIESQFQRNPVV